jgi:phospholipase/carboxylesterase
MNPFGRQWFGLQRIDPQEKWEGVQKAGPELNSFLDDELAAHDLSDSDLALVGFSQGTMMSLHVGLRREKHMAAIVGYSGALAGPEHLAGEIVSKPPVLLVHGAVDEVIPVAALAEAQTALEKEDVSVSSHISEGLGHGIDGDGLMLGVSFLRQYFEIGDG